MTERPSHVAPPDHDHSSDLNDLLCSAMVYGVYYTELLRGYAFPDARLVNDFGLRVSVQSRAND